MSATSNFRGRMLAAGETIELDTVLVSVEPDPFAALEHYGDATAGCSRQPPRTGANSLWCSWYPIRMGISEEVVLAIAEVAGHHFKPLGFDLIQLDHGWQRGDICGDWIPNERFPHGLKMALRATSKSVRDATGPMDRPDDRGGEQPAVPRPSRLAVEGRGRQASRHGPLVLGPQPGNLPARCLASRGEPMVAGDVHSTHGAKAQAITRSTSSPPPAATTSSTIQSALAVRALRRGMETIRAGAGPDAWIRYCQTPPLLSVGLANSSYIGMDTGDAGLPQTPQLLRENAQLLAASYWVNDRLYHREVCDMSVGNQASLEEARIRLALMTLSGCSISFSDDFRQLEPPRIHMMQQCLPPGNPAAKPLDLFERKSHRYGICTARPPRTSGMWLACSTLATTRRCVRFHLQPSV